MTTRVMKVGIISKADYIKRTVAIAKGDYKPRKDEPKIWFDSIKSMAQVLGNENQKLLRLIIDHRPHSLSELERISEKKSPIYQEHLKRLKSMELLNYPKYKASWFQR